MNLTTLSRLLLLSVVFVTAPTVFAQDFSNIPKGNVGVSPNGVTPNGPITPPAPSSWRPQKDRSGRFRRPALPCPGQRGGGGNYGVSPNGAGGVSPNGGYNVGVSPNSPGLAPHRYDEWRLGFRAHYGNFNPGNSNPVVVSALGTANGRSPLSNVYLPPGNGGTGHLDQYDTILGINECRVDMRNFKDVLTYHADRNNGWVYIHVWSVPHGDYAFGGEGLWVKAEKVRL